MQQISLKEIHSALAFRYVPKQNARHAGLLIQINKRLTSAYQAKPDDVYLHDLSTGNTLPVLLYPPVLQGGKKKENLTYLFCKYCCLQAAWEGSKMFSHYSYTLLQACTLHHKLDFKDLTKFTSKSIQIQWLVVVCHTLFFPQQLFITVFHFCIFQLKK